MVSLLQTDGELDIVVCAHNPSTEGRMRQEDPKFESNVENLVML